MASISSVESPDIDVTSVQRQQGQLAEQTLEQFVSPRSSGVSADAAFTLGTRAARPASGLTGDRYFAEDFNWTYVYTGTAWEIQIGFGGGLDATRAAYTPDATDNNAWFWATDTGILWRVESGAWVNRFTTIALTTALKIGSNQVISSRKTGWTSNPTGTLTRTTFDSTTATLADVAERLAALIVDLRSHGLINT